MRVPQTSSCVFGLRLTSVLPDLQSQFLVFIIRKQLPTPSQHEGQLSLPEGRAVAIPGLSVPEGLGDRAPASLWSLGEGAGAAEGAAPAGGE